MPLDHAARPLTLTPEQYEVLKARNTVETRPDGTTVMVDEEGGRWPFVVSNPIPKAQQAPHRRR